MKQLGTKVQYFGIEIVIQYPYVATDENGLINNFERKPKPIRCYFTADGEEVEITKADLEGMDWKDTLVKFKLEK